jgi:hypothetical protein
MAHLANIDVVTMAYLLSHDDKRFGSPKFFEWMRKGLLQSVTYSGHGTSLKDAYDIITIGEETALLNYLGVRVVNTIAAESGAVYYNMHDVEDPKLDETYTVFVNTTKAMQYLDRKAREKDIEFSIQRQ